MTTVAACCVVCAWKLPKLFVLSKSSGHNSCTHARPNVESANLSGAINMRIRQHHCASIARFALLIAIVVWLTPRAWAANYTFTKIADDQSSFSGLELSGPASINDSGEVVFRVTTGTAKGIYKGSGGALMTIAPNSLTQYDYLSFFASINNDGDVVYAGETYKPDFSSYRIGIFKWSAGSIDTVYSMSFSQGPHFYNAAINNSGTVAFVSDPNTLYPGYNYYVVDGLELKVIPVGADFNCCWESPDINDSGQVLYWKKSVGNLGFELERYDDPGVTPVTSGFSSVRPVTMNNLGHVAFIDENGGRVYVFRDGAIHTIAGPDQGFGDIPFLGGAYINDAGKVAFDGGETFFTRGIYVGPDIVADRVILETDTLFGTPINSLHSRGLNNNGQVLFLAELGGTSPYTAIVVATPIIVEPLLGDYNDSGVVDSADYVLWRNTLGQSGAGLAADGNNSGTIDSGDYDVWRAHVGQSAGGGALANSVVPEPSTLMLLALACLAARARLWTRTSHGNAEA